jgi:prepilin signal peptidase PulO-like enzyme (type II secretory pathway)
MLPILLEGCRGTILYAFNSCRNQELLVFLFLEYVRGIIFIYSIPTTFKFVTNSILTVALSELLADALTVRTKHLPRIMSNKYYLTRYKGLGFIILASCHVQIVDGKTSSKTAGKFFICTIISGLNYCF